MLTHTYLPSEIAGAITKTLVAMTQQYRKLKPLLLCNLKATIDGNTLGSFVQTAVLGETSNDTLQLL